MAGPEQEQRRPRAGLLRAIGGDLALLLFLAVCIVAITWPWAAGFAHSFANHWDPPLHAWKVWNMADAILQGRIRPPGSDLNAYFPNSGSLYYESLYWPQGIAAAPVLALTGNPVLAFHLSYLFFWALSGVCFRRMLLEFGAGRAAALLGAVVFALFPYRTGYVVEFNMQLCFGLPLFLLFVARWARTRRPLHAALAAGALCLQASSELYQAVFLALCMPFVLLALLRGRWREWLSSRRFWLSVAAAAAVCLAFVLVLFRPYLEQLDDSVSRPIREIARHALEPFSYLASRKQMRWSLMPPLLVKEREICVYPTLAVLLAALAWTGLRFRARFAPGACPRAERGLRAARAALFALFLVATGAGTAAGGLGPFAAPYAWTPVAIALLSLAIPLVAAYRDDRDRLLDGLCGAAAFAFLMGLGPEIGPLDGEWSVDSPLFLALYRASPVLHGFRVVARFGIVVLIFLVASAAFAWDDLLRAFGRGTGRRAAAIRWAWAPALALVLFESVPLPLPPPRRGTPLDVPVLDALPGGPDAPVALLTVPATHREFDSMYMFRVSGANPDRMMVMSWGGAFPRFTKTIRSDYRALSRNPEPLREHLSRLWPECFLLLREADFRAVYPEPERRAAIRAGIGRIADPIAAGGGFELFRLRPPPPSTYVAKAVRSDFVRSLPGMAFRIVPAPDDAGVPAAATVSVTFNKAPVAVLSVPPEGASYSLPLDPRRCTPVNPDLVRFDADRPVSVEDFRLETPHETRP